MLARVSARLEEQNKFHYPSNLSLDAWKLDHNGINDYKKVFYFLKEKYTKG